MGACAGVILLESLGQKWLARLMTRSVLMVGAVIGTLILLLMGAYVLFLLGFVFRLI
jgi:hypothetical protein